MEIAAKFSRGSRPKTAAQSLADLKSGRRILRSSSDQARDATVSERKRREATPPRRGGINIRDSPLASGSGPASLSPGARMTLVMVATTQATLASAVQVTMT